MIDLPEEILEIIHNSDGSCEDYYMELLQVSKTVEDTKKAALIRLIGDCCSLQFATDSGKEVFRPFWFWANDDGVSFNRSFILVDLTLDQFELLDSLNTHINDDLHARVSDVLWLARSHLKIKTHHKRAQDAVDAYLKSVASLLTRKTGRSWAYNAVDRIIRAYTLSHSCNMSSKIENYIQKHLQQDCKNQKEMLEFQYRLIRELYKINFRKHLTLQIEALQRVATESTNMGCERVYEVLHKLQVIAKDDKGAQQTKIQQAEIALWQAKAHPQAMGKVHFLELAISFLQQAGHQKPKIEQIQRELIPLQRQMVLEMKKVSIPITINQAEIQPDLDSIITEDLSGTLQRFLSKVIVLSVEEIQDSARDSLKQAPLLMLAGHKKVTNTGRPTYIRNNDSLDSEDRLCEQVTPHQSGFGALLDLYLQYIHTKHGKPTREQVASFLLPNKAIPPSRVHAFIDGFHETLNLNYVKASHLLIPQFEHFVRTQMQLRGKITTYIKDGVEQEQSLHILLEYPEAEQLLGPTLLFTFKCLLVKKSGSNLRNDIAHGLLDDGHIRNPVVAYCCFLMLRYFILIGKS